MAFVASFGAELVVGDVSIKSDNVVPDLAAKVLFDDILLVGQHDLEGLLETITDVRAFIIRGFDVARFRVSWDTPGGGANFSVRRMKTIHVEVDDPVTGYWAPVLDVVVAGRVQVLQVGLS